jgi:hypothetical protein
MKLTKDKLEQLYSSMSLDEMANHLKMAKSTLYYHMRKLGVNRRSKSDAQKQHLAKCPHQRTGKKHSDQTREKISVGTREFWDSDNGTVQKRKLGDLRRSEWTRRTDKQRSLVLKRLKDASRPNPGELSNFGKKLSTFLDEKEKVAVGIQLTPDHISDIILEDRKIVIELVLPVSVYGDQQAHKLDVRYHRLIEKLNDLGYRVVVIEDRSNSISRARCQRVYDELLKFFKNDNLQFVTLVS